MLTCCWISIEGEITEDKTIDIVGTYLNNVFKSNNISKILQKRYMNYFLNGVNRGEKIAKKILPSVENKNLRILDFGSVLKKPSDILIQ